jgi:hypothetical protein
MKAMSLLAEMLMAALPAVPIFAQATNQPNLKEVTYEHTRDLQSTEESDIKPCRCCPVLHLIAGASRRT